MFRKLHKKIVSQYLKELDNQINTAAEIDTPVEEKCLTLVGGRIVHSRLIKGLFRTDLISL